MWVVCRVGTLKLAPEMMPLPLMRLKSSVMMSAKGCFKTCITPILGHRTYLQDYEMQSPVAFALLCCVREETRMENYLRAVLAIGLSMVKALKHLQI